MRARVCVCLILSALASKRHKANAVLNGRGGRRSDEGLLRVARELPSPKASEGGTAVRRSGVGGGGLWSIGEEEARQEGGRGALSTPRGVDPLSLSVKSLASIFEKKASPGTPVREASPTTPSSYPNGDHFGDDDVPQEFRVTARLRWRYAARPRGGVVALGGLVS